MSRTRASRKPPPSHASLDDLGSSRVSPFADAQTSPPSLTKFRRALETFLEIEPRRNWAKFAKVIGLNPTTISKAWKGKVKMPPRLIAGAAAIEIATTARHAIGVPHVQSQIIDDWLKNIPDGKRPRDTGSVGRLTTKFIDDLADSQDVPELDRLQLEICELSQDVFRKRIDELSARNKRFSKVEAVFWTFYEGLRARVESTELTTYVGERLKKDSNLAFIIAILDKAKDKASEENEANKLKSLVASWKVSPLLANERFQLWCGVKETFVPVADWWFVGCDAGTEHDRLLYFVHNNRRLRKLAKQTPRYSQHELRYSSTAVEISHQNIAGILDGLDFVEQPDAHPPWGIRGRTSGQEGTRFCWKQIGEPK